MYNVIDSSRYIDSGSLDGYIGYISIVATWTKQPNDNFSRVLFHHMGLLLIFTSQTFRKAQTKVGMLEFYVEPTCDVTGSSASSSTTSQSDGLMLVMEQQSGDRFGSVQLTSTLT